MRPNKYRTARKGPKPVNLGKWPFYGALVFLAVVAYAIWSTVYILSNRNETLLGHAVSCETRVAADYLAVCSPLHDGPACGLEYRSRLQAWYEPIDYACAQQEPPRPFRFPVYQDIEYAEG